MVTGSKRRILGTSDFLQDIIYYDAKGRVLQTYALNQTGGPLVQTNQYSFSGQVLRSYQLLGHNAANQAIGILNIYSYDDLGRLANIKKTTYTSFGLSTPEVTIVKNEYDKLGQLKNKRVGKKRNTSNPTVYTDDPVETLTYDYNIRGWMLGMNRAYLNTNNSTKFSFELAYDKRKSAFDGNSADTYTAGQFNGNITGMMWRSVGDGEKRKYDFQYDEVNRLTKADFTQYTSAWNVSAGIDFSMGGDPSTGGKMKYDDNGNIKEMWQKGLKLTSSDWIDQMRYTYALGTNKLKNVVDFENEADTKLGDFRTAAIHSQNTSKNALTPGSSQSSFDAITDYDYDVNGNLTLDHNKGISSITYNYLNLPQTITVTGKGTITYTYDAAGNKLKKETSEAAISSNNNNSTVTTTFYIGGFVYESKTVNGTPVYSNKLQFGGHEEGRIRTLYTNNNTPHTPTGFAYDYMLKDHLGNVRMVLTDELQTNIYPIAALEDATVSCENNFYAINTSKVVNKSTISDPGNVLGYANNNGFAAGPCGNGSGTSNKMYRLFATSAGADTGLSMTLKVMSGDVINIWGKSFYNDVNSSGVNYAPTAGQLIAGFLGGGLGGATAASHGATPSLLQNNAGTINGLNSFITDPGRGSGDKPKAYINWILFDEQFKFVTGGFSRTDQNANTINDHRFTDLTMSKNGYLYIYVSNESPVAVFFDNLQVTHTRGPVLEETHYYPFGLTMAGISSKSAGTLENKKSKYNGYELNNDFDLNFYESFYRTHDPQLGRFWQIDPRPGYTESPYAAMGNNPSRFSDILGDTAVDRNGKNVGITRSENGKLSYTFDASYSAKQKAKVEKVFMKGAGKVLNSLNNSKAGQKIVDRIASISTKVTIEPTNYNKFNSKLTANANSTVTYGKVMENGEYDKVTIQPYLNLYDSKTGATFDEWLGATMTVEVGHIEKDQIAEEAKGFSIDPKSPDFQRAYTPLMNMATRFMIQYRDEKGMPIIPYNFAPVLGYQLKLDADNQKRKDEMKPN